jgi:hypothetical protein
VECEPNLTQFRHPRPIKPLWNRDKTKDDAIAQLDVFNAAWTFLTERFDKYIGEHGNTVNKGIIIVDRSSKIPEKEIWKIVNRLRRNGSHIQPVENIVEEPIFVDSQIREGIQIADACAYCTIMYLNNSEKFLQYWEIIESKLSSVVPTLLLSVIPRND